MSSSKPFDTLGLKPALLTTLASLDYTAMTPVQAEALPPMLAGADVLARAKTGSGKTAAFGLCLLNKLDPGQFQTQTLVLCPTRELADQVAKELRRLARGIGNVKTLTLCGGSPLGPQIGSLQRSPHVVVGTPGRVIAHLRKGTLKLEALTTLVLDEADRMLDMGFADELDEVIRFVPPERQTLLFSATYAPGIAAISERVQRDAVRVDVTETETPALITQRWCKVTRESRTADLVKALRVWGGELNLVFCNTKIDCAQVGEALREQGIAALALHGDLDQEERNDVLVRFANKSATVLIATDVAARGLDVKDLDVVYNYELPPQPATYVHRIGRTGRAGSQGQAVSLVAPREQGRWRAIEALSAAAAIEASTIPTTLRVNDKLKPLMTTLKINGGRKEKLRPGDLLGALTAEKRVPGSSVGSIDLFDHCAYVAINNADASNALQQLASRPIKGKKFRAWTVRMR